MKTYIVAWSVEIREGVTEDRYRVFSEEDKEENKKNAQSFYNKIKEQTDTYSVNLCKVKKSTDYE